MEQSALEQRLTALARPQLAALGLRLWGIEAPVGGHRQMVRIYVDAEGGVDVDRLAEASRGLGVTFDVEDAVPGAYVLEVSSPGLERRFFEPGQMAGFEGRTVEASLARPLDGRRRFKGRLLEFADDVVAIDEDGVRHDLPWGEVKRIHLVHEF
ncbi:MAG: ribosome maturation factor RimP [Desulfovibrionaceae bacterium]